MKTINITMYKFGELPENIQNKLIEEYQYRDNFDAQYIYDEASGTVSKFCELTGIQTSRNRWLEFRAGSLPENTEYLTGLRLRTWLINNWGYFLFKPKQYSLWSKTEKSYKYHKDGWPVLKKRISRIFFVSDCNLTGVCYDNSFLDPIYKFINEYRDFPTNKYQTLQGILEYCFYELRKDLRNEEDYIDSNEYIRERIQDQDLEYTEAGQVIY